MVSQKWFGTQPPTLVPANMSGYKYTGLEVGTASAIEFIDKSGLHTQVKRNKFLCYYVYQSWREIYMYM